MGRPSKNPDHPITRLRRALSTDTYEMTREAFAKRYGFSAPSIKAIETGMYKLTPEVAARISAATGVSAKSLLNKEYPLKAWNGEEFTSHTQPPPRDVSPEQATTARMLLQAAIMAAQRSGKRNRPVQLLILFQEWIKETVSDLRIGKEFEEQLLFLWDDAWSKAFEPDAMMISRFAPSDLSQRAQWSKRLISNKQSMAVAEGLILELLDKHYPDKGKRYRELCAIEPGNRTEDQSLERWWLELDARKMLAEAKGLSGSDLKDSSKLADVLRGAIFERLRESEA
jgi:plasmid maintenance system antidote protein VapI